MRKLDLGEKLIIEIKKYSETKQANTKRNINRINAEIDKNVETIYRQKKLREEWPYISFNTF